MAPHISVWTLVATESNYCPLCDEDRSEATCPVHHVPTLPPAGPSPPPPIANGSLIIDRYRVEGVLSHGGMGTVLEATQIGINRPMVVKVLRDSRPEDRGRVRRFYQEARLISALDHPNIVSIFEFGLDPVFRVPFIAMERVEGITLQRLLQREGSLSERRAASLFAQIVRALIEAHRKGVLHRDLKPRNVMVRQLPEGGEHLTVLDFGLAKFIEDDQLSPPLTAPGRTVGTPGYMSPEQVLGRTLDFRSDLYGLGCMLHAALTGRPPFEGNAALSVMRRQVREPPPPLPHRLANGAEPSAALRALLSRLLAKDPGDRPSTLEEVLSVFERMSRSRSSSWIEDATTRLENVRSFSNLDPTAPSVAAEGSTSEEDVDPGISTTRSPTRYDSDDVATVRLPSAPRGSPSPFTAAPTPPNEAAPSGRPPADEAERRADAANGRPETRRPLDGPPEPRRSPEKTDDRADPSGGAAPGAGLTSSEVDTYRGRSSRRWVWAVVLTGVFAALGLAVILL